MNKKFFKISIIYFIALILIAIIFALGSLGILKNDYLCTLLIQVVVMFAVPLLLYTIFVSKSFKKTFADTGFKSISGKIIILSFCLGIVVYFLNSYIAEVFYGVIKIFGYENINSTQTISLDYSSLFKEFIVASVLPGFCEEFLHRGILVNSNKKEISPRYVLIISSILFGLMHLNIKQFFYATFIGLLIGYVGLVSDSIFPCMIIHFMNNFLSSYFYYGVALKLPLASIVYKLKISLNANFLLSVISSILFIFLLLYTFQYIIGEIFKERAKRDVKKIVSSLELENLPILEAQKKIDEVNEIINSKKDLKVFNNKTKKLRFLDNIFIISSLILGSIITVSSFIWGII